jgi:threonine/homoserine efflux transporter RhtA
MQYDFHFYPTVGGVVVAALSITAAAILTLCLMRHRRKKTDPLGQSYR